MADCEVHGYVGPGECPYVMPPWRACSMDLPTRAALEGKIKGWEWVRLELTSLRDKARAEALRLLGPDRGE